MGSYLPTLELTEQGQWRAWVTADDGDEVNAYGRDPLIAVCSLVDELGKILEHVREDRVEV